MPQTRIEHVNVTVSDPDRTARLMAALFGWHVRWQGPGTHGGRTIHVGSDDHYIALYTGHGVAYTGADFAKGQPLNHVGVEVDDLTATEAQVVTAGLDCSGTMITTRSGASTSWIPTASNTRSSATG